jgi:hypothetical protein
MSTNMPATIFDAAYENNEAALEHYLHSGISVDAKYTESAGELFTKWPSNAIWYGKRGVSFFSSGVFVVTGVSLVIGAAPVAVMSFAVAHSASSLWSAGDRRLGIYAFNKKDWTPLHFAAVGGSICAAMLLILSNARLDAKDGDGRTYLDIAKSMGNEEFCKACTIFVKFREEHFNLSRLNRELNELRSEQFVAEQELIRVDHDLSDETGALSRAQGALGRFSRIFFSEPQNILDLRNNIKALQEQQRLQTDRIRKIRPKVLGKIETLTRDLQKCESELRTTLAENISLHTYVENLQQQLSEVRESVLYPGDRSIMQAQQMVLN